MREILIVIVRYKTLPADSETVVSLEAIFSADSALLNSAAVLMWDNSPEPLKEPQVSFPLQYLHSSINRGVAGAYNEACKLAATLGCRWLLLLDQDTTLPAEFMAKMVSYSRRFRDATNLAAVLPTIWVDHEYMFPRVVRFGRTRAYSQDFEGITEEETTTANSGVLIRVAALQEIGGYNEEFDLEFSDVYVFHQLHKRGKQFWVAADIKLVHQLAISDYGGAFTPARYERFLMAEEAFITLYKSRAENVSQTVRLLGRSAKQFLRYSDKSFARLSWTQFVRRILIRRSVRLQVWRAQSNRTSESTEPDGGFER